MRSKGCVMKIYKHHVVFIVPILLLIQIATAQQQIPAGSSLVTSPRPLADAARSLQETYGKIVTYEEPILTWRGELQTKPGRNPEAKWELFPMPQISQCRKAGLAQIWPAYWRTQLRPIFMQPLEPAFRYCLRNWVITLYLYKC